MVTSITLRSCASVTSRLRDSRRARSGPTSTASAAWGTTDVEDHQVDPVVLMLALPVDGIPYHNIERESSGPFIPRLKTGAFWPNAVIGDAHARSSGLQTLRYAPIRRSLALAQAASAHCRWCRWAIDS